MCFSLSSQRLPRGLGSLLESTSKDGLKAEAPCSLMNDTLEGLYHTSSIKGLTTSVYSGIWW